MVAVFLAFVLSTDRTIKMIGLGTATAILVDALVVRTVLVPAVMHTLGDANWRLPAWLNRRLPHLDIEGDTTASPVEEEVKGAGTSPDPTHSTAARLDAQREPRWTHGRSGRGGLAQGERTPGEYGSVRREPECRRLAAPGKASVCSQIAVAARRRQMRV
jgi:MMPL family